MHRRSKEIENMKFNDELLIVGIDHAIHKDSYCITDSKNFYDKCGKIICDKDEEDDNI